jgi:N-acyl amino acid synthase of PEP-CTERM/exosortase system
MGHELTQPALEQGPVEPPCRDKGELQHLYARHFATIRADREALKDKFYRLRYQVYCVENPFEDASAQTDGMERDSFDNHSVSSLLVHRSSGIVAGGIRLILPFEAGAPRDLPLWTVCDRDALDVHTRHLPRARTAEVSRNAISKRFRRMMTSLGLSGAANLHQVMRHLSLGLLAAVVQMASERGITHVCAAMEAPMLRMLAGLGVHFQKLGPPVDYHGVRQPAYADLDALLVRTWIERPDVWALITRNGHDWPLNYGLAHPVGDPFAVRMGH